MNDYSSEKVADLIAEFRSEGNEWGGKYSALFFKAADALEAVTADRDWHALQEAGLRDDIGNLVRERDEAHTPTDAQVGAALDAFHGDWMYRHNETLRESGMRAMRAALRAALDKEGQADE